MRKKKVYIFSFDSINSSLVAGLRMYYLKSFLHERNYDVSLICESGTKTEGVDAQFPLKKIFKSRHIRFLVGLLMFPDFTSLWSLKVHKSNTILKDIEGQESPVIITSGPPFGVHRIGLLYKRRFSSARWIVDMRDPFTLNKGYHKNKIRRFLDSNFENKIFTYADIVLFNTYGDKKMYSIKYSRIKDKFLVVRNGYTLQNSAESRYVKEEDFTFVYAGGTYRGVVPHKLSNFFEILNFNENRFSCHCYGEYHDLYKTNEHFDFRGKVSQQELFDALKSYKYGIIYLPERYKNSFRVTQKLYDYIGAGLIPIVINASIEIRQIIQELGYGFVFNKGFNKKLIDNFISQIENHGDISTNQDHLKEFTRDHQFSKITTHLK